MVRFRYKLVKGDSYSVEEEVNRLLKEGWILHHGVSVTHSPSNYRDPTSTHGTGPLYVQAMIFLESQGVS